MNNISKSLMILFFILVGFIVYALQFSTSPDFEVLYEQNFDKEIDEVAFDSYEKDGSVTYYPKIVVLSERDDFTVKREYKHEKYDDKQVFKKVNKEIRIFSPERRIRTSIKGDEYNFYAGGDIYISSNGNYFSIMQVVRKEDFYSRIAQLYFPMDEIREKKRANEDEFYELVREKYEAEYGKLTEPSFRVYNSKGELLWKKEKLWDTDYMPEALSLKILPADGSLLYSFIYQLGYYKIIDPSGNIRKAFPSELDAYLDPRIRFSKNGEYTIIGFKKYPTDFYKKLPGKSSEPGVALLDSNWNILWKKSLDNYLLSSVLISPRGSYIAAATYTMSGTEDKSPAQWTGYLFDKNGNLVMNTPLGGGLWKETLNLFSENEQYFAIPDDKHLSVIDLSKKRMIYEKDFPNDIIGLSVSNDGKCVIVCSGYENLEYYETGRPKSTKQYAIAYVIDVNGEITWDSGKMKAETIQLLGWDNEKPIIGIMDNKNGEIQIGRISSR
jgi:hypothetical protein